MPNFKLNTVLNVSGVNAAGAIRQLKSQLKGINVPINVSINQNTNTTLSKLNSNLRQSTQALKQTGTAAKGAATDMHNFGAEAGLALKRAAAFTVATAGIYGLIRAFSGGVSEAVAFEKEVIKLSQVTRVSVGGLKGLTSEIDRLSVGLGVGSKELLDISVTLAQAGFSAKETKIALEALAKAALAPSFGDLKNTTEAIIAIQNQFKDSVTGAKIAVQDYGKILGSINAVSNAFAVEAEDITSAIRRTGSVFAEASKGIGTPIQQLDELTAIMTSVRSATRLSADSIATGLRTIFSRIQRPTTIAFLEQFGAELTGLDGKFVGPFKALQELDRALSKIENRDPRKAIIVEEIGGIRQLQNLIPAIENIETAQRALQVAQKGQTSLDEDAAIAQQSLSNQLAKTREEFLKLVRDITGTASFKALINSTLAIASGFIKVADAIKEIIPLIPLLATLRFAPQINDFTGSFFARLKGKAAGVRTKAAGGYIDGPGNETSDSIPARLSRGEYVLRAAAVKKIGVRTLDKLNTGFARGGVVGFANGGFNDLSSRLGKLQNARESILGGDLSTENLKTKAKALAVIDQEIKSITTHMGKITGGIGLPSDLDISGGAATSVRTPVLGNPALFGRGKRKRRSFRQEFFTTPPAANGVDFTDIFDEIQAKNDRAQASKFTIDDVFREIDTKNAKSGIDKSKLTAAAVARKKANRPAEFKTAIRDAFGKVDKLDLNSPEEIAKQLALAPTLNSSFKPGTLGPGFGPGGPPPKGPNLLSRLAGRTGSFLSGSNLNEQQLSRRFLAANLGSVGAITAGSFIGGQVGKAQSAGLAGGLGGASGGLVGAGLGAQAGLVLGPGGAAAGAVLGGIAGAASGAVNGINEFTRNLKSTELKDSVEKLDKAFTDLSRGIIKPDELKKRFAEASGKAKELDLSKANELNLFKSGGQLFRGKSSVFNNDLDSLLQNPSDAIQIGLSRGLERLGLGNPGQADNQKFNLLRQQTQGQFQGQLDFASDTNTRIQDSLLNGKRRNLSKEEIRALGAASNPNQIVDTITNLKGAGQLGDNNSQQKKFEELSEQLGRKELDRLLKVGDANKRAADLTQLAAAKIEFLGEKLSRLGEDIDAVGTRLDNFGQLSNDIVNSTSGSGSVGRSGAANPFTRRNSSNSEIQAGIRNVVGFIGKSSAELGRETRTKGLKGTAILDAQERGDFALTSGERFGQDIQKARELQSKLPGILQKLSNPDNLQQSQVNQIFGDLTKFDLPQEILNSIRNEIDHTSNDDSREGGSKSDRVSKISNLLDKFAPQLKDTIDRAAQAFETVKKAQDNYAETVNKYFAGSRQVLEHLLEADRIRADANIRSAERTGRDISFGERTASSRNRISSLTGGRTDVGDIVLRNSNIQKELNGLITRRNAGPVGAGSIEREGKLLDELNKNREALVELTKSTDTLAAIEKEFEKVERKKAAFDTFSDKFFGGGVKGRFDLVREQVAVQRFTAGKTNFRNPKEFELLKSGIETIKSFDPERGKKLADDLRVFTAKFFGGKVGEAGRASLDEPALRELESKTAETMAKASEGLAALGAAGLDTLLKESAKAQIESANALREAIAAGFGGGRAGGGFISGPGSGTSDSIMARLSNGEFVMRAAAVNSIGADKLSYMNNTGEIPEFARGGLFARRRENRLQRIQRNRDKRQARYERQPGGFKPIDRFSGKETALNFHGFANGGLATGGGVGFDSSAFSGFSAAALRLSQTLENLKIPERIEMVGNHTVNVVINGGEVLQNLLSGPIGDLVSNEINKAFSRHVDPAARIEGNRG